MLPARSSPVIGLVAQLALLAAIAATAGLGGVGWVVGTACAVTMSVLLAGGLARHGVVRLGPADRVTLTRATLAVGVAALVADSFAGTTPVTLLVTLTVVALLLDTIDGRVARRTGTTSAFGARFDLEVDAFLILVLSVDVARTTGTWVLAIGAARYGFVAAGWLLPWLRLSLPPRRWCKVVAATQGVVLTIVAAGVLPDPVAFAALVVALAMLAESFGREVWQLVCLRPTPSRRPAIARSRVAVRVAAGRGELGMNRLPTLHRPRLPAAPKGKAGQVLGWVLTGLAGLLVWFALVAPNELSRVTPGAFLRIPLEALLVVALVLVLPAVAGRAVAVLVGLLLGVLAVVKVLDMAFFEALGRPFNPATDRTYVGPAIDFVSDEIGHGTAIAALIGLVLLALLVLVALPLSVLRLTRLADRHRGTSLRVVIAVGVVWLLCAVSGAQLVPGEPIASTSATGLAYEHVSEVHSTIEDRQVFAKQMAVDRFASTPDDALLTGLRGKDVLLVFVESYGRIAVEGSDLSAGVNQVLDAGTDRLRAAGFSARSAFLTSPTFGAGSWLAHASLQSGLWVDDELRYADLLASDRLTLSDAFNRAGWRTVGTVPANDRDWPEGESFYDFDAFYDSRNVGYAGPEFSYASMPDQYTLSAFHRLELARRDRPPVMAEIDLVSSHNPWTPVPHMIGWDKVGDGSVFDDMPARGQSPDEVWPDPTAVQRVYGQTIEYSLNALVSYVQTYGDQDLVLVVLGDHQPATIVSGSDADRDVPITVIARDPAVMDRISPWGWQPGMHPGPDAPVWPMNDFRDRFLAAYGPHPPSTLSPPDDAESD